MAVIEHSSKPFTETEIIAWYLMHLKNRLVEKTLGKKYWFDARCYNKWRH